MNHSIAFGLVFLILSIPAADAAADGTASSQAYGELTTLQVVNGTRSTTSGPLPLAMGAAPPSYTTTTAVEEIEVTDVTGLIPLLRATAAEVSASSTFPTSDRADAQSTVSELELLSDLLVSLQASAVRAVASVEGTCGETLTATAETLIADGWLETPTATLAIVSDPEPHTVLFDALGIRIIANEQLVFGDGVTYQTVIVNALRLEIDDLAAGALLYDGDIVISRATAEIICPGASVGFCFGCNE